MSIDLRAKHTHYHWHDIILRDWFDEAKRMDFSVTELHGILDNILADNKTVLDDVPSRHQEVFHGRSRIPDLMV